MNNTGNDNQENLLGQNGNQINVHDNEAVNYSTGTD